jgi:hypothetical protein
MYWSSVNVVIFFSLVICLYTVLMQRKQSKNMKRKTRQGKALEKKAARSFMDVLQEVHGTARYSSYPRWRLIIFLFLQISHPRCAGRVSSMTKVRDLLLLNCVFDRQTWSRCLPMSQRIPGPPSVPRAPRPGAITARSAAARRTTRASGAGRGSARAAARSFTTIPAAWNSWPDRSACISICMCTRVAVAMFSEILLLLVMADYKSTVFAGQRWRCLLYIYRVGGMGNGLVWRLLQVKLEWQTAQACLNGP